MEEKIEKNEEIKQIRDKIFNKPDLVINRVPKNTLLRFKELASNDEFSQDYGFALKFLMDFYLGIIPSGIEHLETQIDSLQQQMNELKNTEDTSKDIKLANGRIITNR